MSCELKLALAGVIVNLFVALGTISAVIVALMASLGYFSKKRIPVAKIDPLKADIKFYASMNYKKSIHHDISFIRFPIRNMKAHVAENVFVKVIKIVARNPENNTGHLETFEPFKLNFVGDNGVINLYPEDNSNMFDLATIFSSGTNKDLIDLHPFELDNPRTRGFNPVLKKDDYDIRIGIFGDNIQTKFYDIHLAARGRDAKTVDVSIKEVKG